jgi:hypothetical protein
MLGRKDFTGEEIEAALTAVREQLATFRAIEDGERDTDALEPVFFNAAALALDRRFVHRLRTVTGKAGTPLNELELVADALMNNGGVFRTGKVISYRPERSVLGFEAGDRVELTADAFERLAKGVFAELSEKFQ